MRWGSACGTGQIAYAADDAETKRGGRAGERLDLGPDYVPHIEALAADTPAALKAMDTTARAKARPVVSVARWVSRGSRWFRG